MRTAGEPGRTAALPRVSGIVLAGGRSSRYGGDKLAATIDGRSLLELAIAALSPIAAEIVVVLAPTDERDLRPGVDAAAAAGDRAAPPIRGVRDPEPFGGPLVGLLAGLEAATEPLALVVGGDMPSLEPAVLGLLVRSLAATESGPDAIVLSRGTDPRPLPMAIRTGAATDAARRLVGDGERRLRSLPIALRMRILSEGEWRPLDPAARTLVDVDRPGDLPPGQRRRT